jgi:hypothetical protein|tara:strand:+ start:2585 stop:2746 length:162 start_codon:yes stop_codon:yes gene_type:complete
LVTQRLLTAIERKPGSVPKQLSTFSPIGFAGILIIDIFYEMFEIPTFLNLKND